MNAPLAIRWLNALYSDRCALPIATKGVLCGIFVRIDWESGRGYFEAARSLGKRANCGKNTVTRHLTKAVNAGWLMRTTRAVKGESHVLASDSCCVRRKRTQRCPAAST
jgi:hypothetical protein